jgi:hypothetical protein
MPGVGWLIAVLVVGTVARPPDEVVIPAKLGPDPGVGTVGTLYLLLGAVGAVVAILLANRDRTRWGDDSGESRPPEA